MDNKRLIVTIACLLIVVLTWDPLFTFVGKKMGWDMTPRTADTAASNQPTISSANNATAGSPMPGVSTQPMSMSATTAPAGLAIADAGSAAQTADIGSVLPKDSAFSMGISLTPRGAGFTSVTLNDYKKSVNAPDPYVFQQPYEDHEDQSTPLATKSITIDGSYRDLSDVNWKLESADSHSARYVLDLLAQGKPLARLVKTFEVFHRDDVANGSGWEAAVTQTVQNKTDHAINIGSELIGPTAPPREQERAGDRQIISGYLQNDEITLVHHTVEEFTKDKATKDLTKGDADSPLAWGGACSAYFNAIVRPLAFPGSKITKFSAQALDPDPDALQHYVTPSFDVAAQVAPGAVASFPFRVFSGPNCEGFSRTLITPHHRFTTIPRW